MTKLAALFLAVCLLSETAVLPRTEAHALDDVTIPAQPVDPRYFTAPLPKLSMPFAVTRYARSDGGPSSRCTGLTNAADTGSGTNQPCALSNFQEFLNALQVGDTGEVRAGDTFDATSAPFSVPAKSGGINTIADLIIVRSSAHASLPAGRVTAANASSMFRIRSLTAQGALKPAQNSRWWKFVGMEVTSAGSVVTGRLVDTGWQPTTGDTPESWGNHFTFDHCWFHPQEDPSSDYSDRTADVAFGWNAGAITITKSRMSGFGGFTGGQTIASGCFWSNVGGPYLLDDNYCSAGFNPIFLGAGENGSANMATITAASATQATLSNVTNLQIGDYIALETHVPSSGGYDFWLFNVTANSTTNTLTSAGHGFNNDDAAYVNDWSDTAVSVGLSPRDAAWQVYYIINKTENTFQLSTTKGGSAVDLTGNTPNGGIRVGSNGHQWVNAEITGIAGNVITYSGGLVRWEGDTRPDAITPYQYVVSSQLPLVGGQAKWRGFQVHDFTATHNTFDIDFALASAVKAATGSNAKGYMEIKNLDTGLIEGNIFTGYPTSLAFTLANQNSTSPWVVIKDVTVRSNLYESFTTMLIAQLISGTMTPEGSNIQFTNNLGYNIHDVDGIIGQEPVMLYTAGGTLTPLTVAHNTMINKPQTANYKVALCVVPMPNPLKDTGNGLIFKDNILFYGNSGFLACTAKTFAQSWPHFVETKNGWIDSVEFPKTAEFITGASGHFPNSLYLANDTLVQFTNAGARNYSLQATSPWNNAASDGTDVGVDWAELQAVLAGGSGNSAPTVNAGSNQSLGAGTTSTTLTATANDPESDTMTFLWTRISGPNTPTIVSPTALSTSITGMIAGTYIFRMTATDTVSNIGSDDVQVVVAASGSVTVCKWSTSPPCQP